MTFAPYRYPWPDQPELMARGRQYPVVRFAVGEYYSTIPDTREIVRDADRIWPDAAWMNPMIDWRHDSQLALLAQFAQDKRLEFAAQPDEHADPPEYGTLNDQYPALDAWLLEAFLRHVKPQRMIEVGAGFSTLVSARANREFLDHQMQLDVIEPYPRAFLRDFDGVHHIHERRIEHIPLDQFASLKAGDVLFIDTSHTVRTGGDVHWIFSRVIPSLAPGVLVHVHDVYLPGEYPKRWVLDGWAWNENYLVEAFLTGNSRIQIRASSQYLIQFGQDALLDAIPGYADAAHAARGGSALWFEIVAAQ